MRFKDLILTTMCFCLALQVMAQETFVLKGVVSKRLSGERIAQVLITNLKTRDIMMSDQLGWFSIKVSIGDTILFSKIELTDQKLVVTNKNDIPVYMQPVISLNEVTITGQTKKQELSEVMGQYKSQGTFYDGKPPVLSFLTSPITGIYELFGATPNRAKRFAAFSKDELEYNEVHKRYNLAFVKRITNASDSVAINFMRYYTPTIEDLKGWNDYELIRQVKKSYEYYDKNQDKQKLEELNTPTFMKPKDNP